MKLHAVRELRDSLARIVPADLFTVDGLEIFFGPSPDCDRPVILCTLNVAPGFGTAPDLLERVHALFPDRPVGRRVGAAEPAESTQQSLGQLAASIAADLSAVGMGVPFASGLRAGPGPVAFWVEYLVEPVGVYAIRAAVTAVAAAIVGSAGAEARLRREVVRFDQTCARRRPNNESRLLIEAARRRHVPFLPLSDYPSLWQFGWGARSEHFWVTSSNGDGLVGGYVSRIKDYHKRLIRSLGLPTPDWRVLPRDGDPVEAANAIGFPCVVKPIDRGAGKGVTADIRDLPTLHKAVAAARKFSATLLVESHQAGDDHRLMVADGRLVMAIRRRPATVEGDGELSVRELVAKVNDERERDARQGGYLKPVPADRGLEMALASQGLTINSVPGKGQPIRLRTNANHATGGVVDNVIDRVHPDIARYSEQLALAAGFRLLGIDYVTPDIGRSHDEVGGGFIEINATPGLEVLITEGLVPAEIADLVLGTKPGRIPVCLILADTAVIGDIGSKLSARLVEGAGLATADWVQLGSLRLPKVDLHPAARAWSLLRFPTVTSLVVLWTVDDLVGTGMPVDTVDETIVAGVPPVGDWLSVVERHSTRLGDPLLPGEVVDHVLRWLQRPEQRTD